MARELSKNQVKYFEDYIQRAGENITRFVEDEYPTKTIDVDGGWFEYSFEKDSEDGQKVFFIHTAYSNMEHKDTKKIWNKIKAYAEENGLEYELVWGLEYEELLKKSGVKPPIKN